MRKYFLILLFPFALQAQTPIAQWLFDNNPVDSIGAYDLTAKASPAYSTTAKEPTHSFNQVNAEDRFMSPVINLGNRFTISGWFRMSGTNAYPIGVCNLDLDDYGWKIWFYTATNQVFFSTTTSAGTNSASSNTSAFVNNTFTHVLASVDKTAGTCKLYIDGVLNANDGTIRTDFNTNDSISIGSRRDGWNDFVGYIDNLQIYNDTVTALQADSLYDYGTSGFYLGATGSAGPYNPAEVTGGQKVYLATTEQKPLKQDVVMYFMRNIEMEPVEPSEYFDFLFYQDFEDDPLGTYYQAVQGVADFPGTTWVDWNEAYPPQTVAVSNSHRTSSTKGFRANFGDGQLSDETILQWTTPVGNNTEIYMSYNIRFNPNFEPVVQGKMPGFSIGSPFWPHAYTEPWGPPDNYGSAFTMSWYVSGSQFSPCLYIYHHDQYGEWGDLRRLRNETNTDYYYVTKGQWFNITVRVVLNDPGYYNGVVQVFLNGKLADSRTNYRLRLLSNLYADRIWMGTMFGSVPTFEPIQDDWLEIDDWCIYQYKTGVDVPRGNTEYFSWGNSPLTLPNWTQ